MTVDGDDFVAAACFTTKDRLVKNVRLLNFRDKRRGA